MRGDVQIDLIETNLLGAFARHINITDGFYIEMAQRQAVHVMRLMALQHVRLQQRIALYATQHNAVIGKDVFVVFQVLPDLLVLSALQPWPESGKRLAAIQLIRRTGVYMRQRQIGRLVRRDGKGNADQLCFHHIKTGRLGIQTDQIGDKQLLQPCIELHLSQDRLVMSTVGAGSLIRHAILDLRQGSRLRALLAPALPLRGWRRVVPGSFASDLTQPCPEFQTFKQAGQLLLVLWRGDQIAVGRQVGHIAFHGDQTASLRQPVHRISQISPHHAAYGIRVAHQHIQRAMLVQPFRRRLGTHFFHTRHVVHHVARQRQVIHNQRWRHAKLGRHARNIQNLVVHGVDQRHMFVHQLSQILVAGRDDAAHAIL